MGKSMQHSVCLILTKESPWKLRRLQVSTSSSIYVVCGFVNVDDTVSTALDQMLGQAYLYWPLYIFTFQGIGIKYFTIENCTFIELLEDLFLFFSYVGVCVFIRVCRHKCRGLQRSEMIYPLELKLHMVVSCHTWVLGIGRPVFLT